MKNYEKYAEKIREYNGCNFCTDFVVPYVLKSDDCFNNCSKCGMVQVLWLLEDYEEPKEPKVDWSKVEVDTPVLVRDGENDEWKRFYFAKYENGLVYTWIAGATSWTAKGNMYKMPLSWRFAKLAESEDKCEKPNKEESKIDWSQVEVDTPILVKNYVSDKWLKKHFAKYENGIVYAWAGGKTSWTEDCATSWNYAKLAESE